MLRPRGTVSYVVCVQPFMHENLVNHFHLQAELASTGEPFSIFPLGKRRIKITCALESAGPRDEGFGQITRNVRTYEFSTKTRRRHCNTAIAKWRDQRDALIDIRSLRDS